MHTITILFLEDGVFVFRDGTLRSQSKGGSMERIKRNFPVPDIFKRCQLCGFTSKHDDICEFRMLISCDENDKPEPGNVLIRCQQEACVKAIADHPRLYVDVPWGRGAPGHFILVCGD